jgi:anti-sigma factor RsiW
MNCDRSKALVSVYVDGELSEELAGPLRRHLMECAECRASVSEAKAMASWFVPGAAIDVPEGFAARVARLAASGAGAPGAGSSGRAAGGDDRLVPSRATRDSRPGIPVQLGTEQVGAYAHPSHGLGAHGQSRSIDRTARFAMSLAAMAAAVLIGLTSLLASGDGAGFEGSAIQAQPPVENVLSVLEELNRREAAAAVGVTSTQVPPAEMPGARVPAPGAPALQDATEQPKSPR